MALEDLTGSSKFISALNPAWPVDDDWVDEGDNHIRGIKNVLRNTFPALDGPVTLTDEQMNGVLVAAPESKIINGNFAIDQRNAGAAVNVNADSIYTQDRWVGFASGGGVFQVQRFGDGSSFAMRGTVGTVDSSLAAGDYYVLGQTIEGSNVVDMQFGTGIASAFTLSLDMICSVAATLPVSFRNAAPSMSYVKTVTLAASVWTPITMTIPGPTTGTWNNGNGKGLQILIGLGVGSTFQAPATDSWQAGNFFGAAGCTNLMATNGAFLQVRNVRLYPGSIDYGPCRRLYADELRLCQRYFQKSYEMDVVPGTPNAFAGESIAQQITSGDVRQAGLMRRLSPPMRAIPAVVWYSPVSGGAGAIHNASKGTNVGVIDSENPGAHSTGAPPVAGGSGTAGDLWIGHFTARAEL